MREIILAILIGILVIIAICISQPEQVANILSSLQHIPINTKKLRELGRKHFRHKKWYQLPHGASSLGMYNLSVRKLSRGYSGLIRASSYDGCRAMVIGTVFSYPFHILLDDEGEVLEATLLDFDYQSINKCDQLCGVTWTNGIEDARLFMYHGEEWGCANILGSPQQQHPCVNTMCIFKVSNPQQTFTLLQPPAGIDPQEKQKNWALFEHEGKLLCEYSLYPHVILEINPQTGETTALTPVQRLSSHYRLGAAPIRISYNNNEYYLGVGHVRSPGPDYTNFFYVFETQYPFTVIAISEDYKFDIKARIQFVSGISEYDNKLYVNYGIDDCDNGISIFDKNEVMKLLLKK